MVKPRKVRLLLVDDHPVVRDGVKARLERLGGVEIVGEANDGHQALKMVRQLRPDMVFMDIGMPGMNGLEATRRLQRDFPDTKIIMLTVQDDREYVVQALRAGARGYLLKNAPAIELVRALEHVDQGQLFFPEEVSKLVIEEVVQGGEGASRPELTLREREVLALVARGLSNRDIADALDIGVRTVETHREHIMEKLDIHTVAGLTRHAIAEGIISLQE